VYPKNIVAGSEVSGVPHLVDEPACGGDVAGLKTHS